MRLPQLLFQNSYFCQANALAIFHTYGYGAFLPPITGDTTPASRLTTVLNKWPAPVNGFFPYLGEFAIYPVLAAIHRRGTAPIADGVACIESAGLLTLQYPAVLV